jgi:hypothetical protein
MKRNKNFGALIGLLVVLAGAALVLANPFKQPKLDATGAESGGEAAGSGKLLVDAERDKISEISIKPAGGEVFKLRREGEAWYAEQGDKKYRADMDRVDKLLEDLPGLRSEVFVTDKAEKYAGLGLDDANAIAVDIYASGDKPVAQLLVGNAGPSYATSYVRAKDKPEVYESTANVKSLVAFSYRDYRTKQPWKFDAQTATKLTVRPVAGQPAVYTNDKGTWKTASGANANQNLITTLLHDWTEAKVSDFADDTTPGVTPYDPTLEETEPAGTGGKDAKGNDLPPVFKLGTEPNLVVETPQGTFALTLGVKEKGLYYIGDQDKLAYRIGEPEIKFFRELKFDELKIPAAEGKAAEAGDAAAGAMAAPFDAPPAAPGTK